MKHNMVGVLLPLLLREGRVDDAMKVRLGVILILFEGEVVIYGSDGGEERGSLIVYHDRRIRYWNIINQNTSPKTACPHPPHINLPTYLNHLTSIHSAGITALPSSKCPLDGRNHSNKEGSVVVCGVVGVGREREKGVMNMFLY